MKKTILILWPVVSMAAQLPPTPFPVFLKAGFSSVLEFEEAPLRVVLGDGQSFQVEKADRSLVIRTLTPYAASNMFVYFRQGGPRLFILTASEDANPTYYQMFKKDIFPRPVANMEKKVTSNFSLRPDTKDDYELRVLHIHFDSKKDYLTLECEMRASSKEVLKPVWDLLRLSYQSKTIVPFKLWAERPEVQKDTKVKFRLIFRQPNLPRNMKGVTLIIPLAGHESALSVSIEKGANK